MRVNENLKRFYTSSQVRGSCIGNFSLHISCPKKYGKKVSNNLKLKTKKLLEKTNNPKEKEEASENIDELARIGVSMVLA